MPTLLTNISSLVTCNSNGSVKKSGTEMQNIGETRNGALLFDTEIIWIGNSTEALAYCNQNNLTPTIIDCTGKTVLPGFVDSHTHIVFAGSRAEEFARRLRGVSYQQIASEGGGILRTMNAVRVASQIDIEAMGRKLALSAMNYGTTTIEIKSGYGLTTESELKLLRAIKTLRMELPIRIISTFLGAHDLPPEFRSRRNEYIDTICNEMIPIVAEEHLAEFCDVFTDTGYFTIPESERILETAIEAGLRVKVHADELSSFGAAEMAAHMNAVSADHLLFISDVGIEQMRKSGTIATLLPGTAYTLKLPFAPARKMIERGLAVALATDCNPGSCFMENMQMVLSLACTMGGMTVEEAISAATINGAAALGISSETGSLEIGKSADFIIADCKDYAELVYHFGTNQVGEVWIRGNRVV
ncbi:MAG: imidazolonepropionase [Ignavibacteriae bacterium]|nr:imidazolonepropionase [Ignavibacteriota bacterium]